MNRRPAHPVVSGRANLNLSERRVCERGCSASFSTTGSRRARKTIGRSRPFRVSTLDMYVAVSCASRKRSIGVSVPPRAVMPDGRACAAALARQKASSGERSENGDRSGCSGNERTALPPVSLEPRSARGHWGFPAISRRGHCCQALHPWSSADALPDRPHSSRPTSSSRSSRSLQGESPHRLGHSPRSGRMPPTGGVIQPTRRRSFLHLSHGVDPARPVHVKPPFHLDDEDKGGMKCAVRPRRLKRRGGIGK